MIMQRSLMTKYIIKKALFSTWAYTAKQKDEMRI